MRHSPGVRVGRAEIHDEGFQFNWNDEVLFETIGGHTVHWLPGAQWQGCFPTSFYSSVAAMVLAWRGMLPLHASSIIYAGKAWLIAGQAGAGKSTLVAELIGAGGSLLADDLTVLEADSNTAQIVATRGRPAMRLHPETAGILDAEKIQLVDDDPRGKLLVWPKTRASDDRFVVGGTILLGGDKIAALEPAKAAAAVGATLFRPKILSKIPGQPQRRRQLLDLAQQLPVYRFPVVDGFGDDERGKRMNALTAILDRLGS
jgi:hypothetical protein